MDEIMRRRSERLSSLLAELDPSHAQTQASASAIRPLMMRRTRMPTALKIAAAIALLLGLTWAVPPARAWMLARARDVAEALGVASAPAPAAAPRTPAANEAPETAALRLSFPITVDTFDIAALPGAGELIVRHNSEASGTAEAVAAPGTSFTILRGLRIQGQGSVHAQYTVTLPMRVIAVRVRGRVYPLPAQGDELRLDLARP